MVLVLFSAVLIGWYAVLVPSDEPTEVSISPTGMVFVRIICVVALPLAASVEFAVTYWSLQEEVSNPFSQGAARTHEQVAQWLQAALFTTVHLAAGAITTAAGILWIQEANEAALLNEDDDVVVFPEREKK